MRITSSIYQSCFEKPINFISNNPAYFFCIAIYYLLTFISFGGTGYAFFFVTAAYYISFKIVASETGEKILRYIEDVRTLETRQEKEYLLPLYEEVLEEAKQAFPDVKNLELCVIDSMTVNACAMGRNTLAVTKGAMTTFSENELKAIMLHEIGHNYYKDTLCSLFMLVGNGIVSLIILMCRLILNVLDVIQMLFSRSKIILILLMIISAFFEGIIFVFSLVMNFLMALNSRSDEFRADEFAFLVGYGEDMLSALYLLEKISLSEKRSMIEKLLASHPIVPRRIGNMERLLDEEIA